jgi:hypothetical protein
MNRRWLRALERRHLDSKELKNIRQYQAQELCIATDDPRLKGTEAVRPGPAN